MHPDRLLDTAQTFADELTSIVTTSVGDCSDFQATIIDDMVSIRQDPDTGIPLRVGGEPLLNLKVSYKARWDSAAEFLTVHESAVKVYVGSKAAGEPLFRYEFDRNKTGEAPKAHIQVHGHRDALAFVMTRSGISTSMGKQRVHRIKQVDPPRMAELHFPVGGDRFRPAMEDVLEMLINELGVDCVDGWRESLAGGRANWRKIQASAVVRDDPAAAASTLIGLGYTVTPPNDGHPTGKAERLREI